MSGMTPEEMFDAARVGRFIEPGQHGRWKIERFSISERQFQMMSAEAVANGGALREQRLKRTVPPGDYVSLLRRATPAERKDIAEEKIVDAGSPDGDTDWVPIMSDTPSEIGEHAHAFEHARGNVVVTGLGLGVVVNVLLHKPEVEHVTVVEIDRDVIALTGRYYEDDPKVTIVNADALGYAEQAWKYGLSFDYAWHDIWSHIAERNLTDDSIAEHGISYRTMFESYGRFTDRQGAWAYPEAVEMKEIKDRENAAEMEWAKAVLKADADGKVELFIDHLIRDYVRVVGPGEPVPGEIRQFCIDKMGFRERAVQLVKHLDYDRLNEAINAPPDMDPMGRPNDAPEANVARREEVSRSTAR